MRNDDGAHPSLRDRGEDAPADHGGVSVELQVIQQQARGQQHGRGVGGVVVGDALAGVPGALHIEEHAEKENTFLRWFTELELLWKLDFINITVTVYPVTL